MKHVFQSFYLDAPLQRGRIFDVFEPETVTKETAVFFIHGGGWKAGSRTGHHVIMQQFNEDGYLCASTDYRLSGVNAFDQLQDVRESYDSFVSLLKAKKRPLRIAVAGSSAGAHLASLLLCAEPGECGEKPQLENEWVKPVRGILQSTPSRFTPWEDIFPHIWTTMQAIAGAPYAADPGRYERLSLSHYIRKGNPPLFFAEAENEHMFPPEMNWELVRKQRELGIPAQWKLYTRAEHGFFYDLIRRQQKEFYRDIRSFLDTGKVDGNREDGR